MDKNTPAFENIDESVAKQMAMLKIQRQDKADLLKIPDPTVFKHDCPVKAMLVLEKVIITGNDRGEIKIISKNDFM